MLHCPVQHKPCPLRHHAANAQGVGVPQDDKRACVLYKLAADQGHHFAQYNIGNMYKQGQGVNQSDTLAFKYFQL